MRIELIEAAGSTDTGHVNLSYTGLFQRTDIGGPQVKVSFASPISRSVKELVPIPESIADLRYNFRADLIMARPDRRPNPGYDVRRARTVSVLHRAHRRRAYSHLASAGVGVVPESLQR